MKKKEQKSAAELYEIQPEELVDISEQAFEDVRVSLEKVEAMKQTVAEGIIKAKEKGLKDHVEKLRALLRKLVVMENALKEEQNKKETAKMAFELDKLAAECNREISTKDEPATPVSNETKFVTVAMRYNVAAKLIGMGKSCALAAELSGFGESSGMIRAFRREFGLTPTKYVRFLKGESFV